MKRDGEIVSANIRLVAIPPAFEFINSGVTKRRLDIHRYKPDRRSQSLVKGSYGYRLGGHAQRDRTVSR